MLPYPVQFQENITKWQLQTEEIIQLLEYDFRGEHFRDNKWMPCPGARPIMNDLGIKNIISIIRTRANKIIYLSELDEQEIYAIARDVGYSVADLLYMEFEAYEIKLEDLDVVLHKVCDLTFISLKRAKDAGERKFIETIESRNQSTPQPQPEQKGFFQSLGLGTIIGGK